MSDDEYLETWLETKMADPSQSVVASSHHHHRHRCQQPRHCLGWPHLIQDLQLGQQTFAPWVGQMVQRHHRCWVSSQQRQPPVDKRS